MFCQILAAGRGSRFEGLKAGYKLKGLAPLTPTIRSTLNLLIEQLTFKPISKIVIVGGYNYHLLEHFVARKLKTAVPLSLVDARQVWAKGPLYSFLAFSPNHPTLVFPGDTVFSWDVIQGIFDAVSKTPKNLLSIFYVNSQAKVRLSEHMVEIDSTGRVENILPIQKSGTSQKSEDMCNFLIPIVFVTPDFYNWCQNTLVLEKLGKEPSLFGAIRQYLQWGGKIAAKKVHCPSPFFRDIDTPEQYESVKNILLKHPDKFIRL